MSKIVNKNALVIGGTGGIGSEIVRHLIQHGVAKLAVLDILPNATGQAKCDSLFGVGRTLYRHCLVDRQSDVSTAFHDVISSFNHLDIVINSAGVLDDLHPEQTIAINLGGVVNSTLIAMEVMRKDRGGKGGVILNIASITGLDPFRAIPIYSASKHGVVGLTRGFNPPTMHRLSGVTVVAVCPGITETTLVDDIGTKALFPEMKHEFDEFYRQMSHQGTEVVAACVVKVIDEGSNGSIWICDGGKIREAKMPDLEDY